LNHYNKKYELALDLGFATIFHNKEDGILLIRYTEETEVDLTKAEIVIDSVHKILKDGKTPYGFTDATAKRIHITPAARKAYRDNPSMRLNKKHAILVKGLSNRILANAFIKYDKPIVDSKIFNDFQDAETWLLS